jgi:hypothetical protein
MVVVVLSLVVDVLVLTLVVVLVVNCNHPIHADALIGRSRSRPRCRVPSSSSLPMAARDMVVEVEGVGALEP